MHTSFSLKKQKLSGRLTEAAYLNFYITLSLCFHSSMPLSHQPVATASQAATGGSNSMPMPPGLLPVGNAVSATTRTAAGAAGMRPPSNFLGGSAAIGGGSNPLIALRQ